MNNGTVLSEEENEWISSLVSSQIAELKKEDAGEDVISELFGILEKVENKLSEVKPVGDMVECFVYDKTGASDIATWGNSGFANEPNSFFEPKGKNFTASEIVLWGN